MRPKQILTVALSAGLVLFAGSANAATSNTGGPESASTGNVLTESPTGGVTILYAPSEADDAGFRASIAALTGGTVDYFDARPATPSLATMQGYSCVLTWVNYAYSNEVLMGDNMADFVDGGGIAVLGAFATCTGCVNNLSGRIMTSGYSPVTGGSNHASSSNYAGDGVTTLHDGVVAYDAVYRDFLTLQGTGAQDGSYLDGEIAQAYNPAFSVIYSNGAGGIPVLGGGDWPQLIANACSGAGPNVSLLEIPTLGKLGIAFLALALVSGAILLLRRRATA